MDRRWRKVVFFRDHIDHLHVLILSLGDESKRERYRKAQQHGNDGADDFSDYGAIHDSSARDQIEFRQPTLLIDSSACQMDATIVSSVSWGLAERWRHFDLRQAAR